MIEAQGAVGQTVGPPTSGRNVTGTSEAVWVGSACRWPWLGP